MRRLIGLLLAGLLLGGCGVGTQNRPEPVDTTAAAPRPPAPTPPGMEQVRIYLVRDDRLQPVTRHVADRQVQSALAVLVDGPTSAEARAGLRTALAPQPLRMVGGVDQRSGTVVIAVTSAFTGVSGANQKLAVAQVVWTVTEPDGADRVRFVLEGEPIEVPTDRGLTVQPVGRDAYRSVARAGRKPPRQ